MMQFINIQFWMAKSKMLIRNLLSLLIFKLKNIVSYCGINYQRLLLIGNRSFIDWQAILEIRWPMPIRSEIKCWCYQKHKKKKWSFQLTHSLWLRIKVKANLYMMYFIKHHYPKRQVMFGRLHILDIQK